MNQFYTFEVSGTGDFPFDMLRYDRCWPARELEDSYKISPFDGYLGPRTIRLVGLAPPTGGRWASFGWRVRLP